MLSTSKPMFVLMRLTKHTSCESEIVTMTNYFPARKKKKHFPLTFTKLLCGFVVWKYFTLNINYIQVINVQSSVSRLCFCFCGFVFIPHVRGVMRI